MTDRPPTVPVYGLIPAAGMGRRMGVRKQSLPYGESTLAGHVAQTMLAADLIAVVVVTSSELIGVLKLPNDKRLIAATNDDPQSQMMDSVRIGLDRLNQVYAPPHCAGVLVIPADMPTIPPGACRQCVATFQRDPTRIVIATCHGKRGHPIIFPVALRKALDGIKLGLNELPVRHADLVIEVVIDNPAILRDVDTPSDFRQLTS